MEVFDKKKFDYYTSETLKLFDKLKDEGMNSFIKKEEDEIEKKFLNKEKDSI